MASQTLKDRHDRDVATLRSLGSGLIISFREFERHKTGQIITVRMTIPCGVFDGVTGLFIAEIPKNEGGVKTEIPKDLRGVNMRDYVLTKLFLYPRQRVNIVDVFAAKLSDSAEDRKRNEVCSNGIYTVII